MGAQAVTLYAHNPESGRKVKPRSRTLIDSPRLWLPNKFSGESAISLAILGGSLLRVPDPVKES